MISTETPSPSRSRGHVIRSRLLAVALSVAAALAVWLVATLAGAELEVTSPLVGTLTIDVLLVVVSALPLALAAWGVLAVLERFIPARARRVWTVVAIAVLALSIPPLALLDATLGTKVALAFMHLATGLVLIVLLRNSRRGS
jgi:hypothetical protein